MKKISKILLVVHISACSLLTSNTAVAEDSAPTQAMKAES